MWAWWYVRLYSQDLCVNLCISPLLIPQIKYINKYIKEINAGVLAYDALHYLNTRDYKWGYPASFSCWSFCWLLFADVCLRVTASDLCLLKGDEK